MFDFRGREKHRSVASHMHPNQGLNPQTLVHGMMLQLTEPPSLGCILCKCKEWKALLAEDWEILQCK